ncbi:MAG: hypothetical protein RLN72_15505 [Henriciella sp.]
MNGTYFETFMVGGLALLVACVLSIAWLLWRQDDTRREAIGLSLEGIGHEFRFNMFQTVREIGDVAEGLIRSPVDLPTLAHPQLDAVLSHLVATDKRALAAVQATYQSIEASKRRVRMALEDGEVSEDTLDGLKAAAIDGISTLYLWEDHEGRPPEKARSTRSWWVRDWMKAHGFAQDLMPGLALRDAVVDNLRANGMVLTPQPLALSAYEYYSRHYDRKADPRGVFGKRSEKKKKEKKPKSVAEEVEVVADDAPEPVEAMEPRTVAAEASVAEPAPEPVRTAAAAPEAPYEPDVSVADVEEVETPSKPGTGAAFPFGAAAAPTVTPFPTEEEIEADLKVRGDDDQDEDDDDDDDGYARRTSGDAAE